MPTLWDIPYRQRSGFQYNTYPKMPRKTLRWRHNVCDGVSNHQPHGCLLNSLFWRRSKKTSKFRVTGLCLGNSPWVGEFPAQMASNAEMFSFDDIIMQPMNIIQLHVLYHIRVTRSLFYHKRNILRGLGIGRNVGGGCVIDYLKTMFSST